MIGLIRKIKLILSASYHKLLNYKQGNIAPIWPGAVILVSFIFVVIFINPKFSSVTGDEWWSKFITWFVISFIIALYKDELKKIVSGWSGLSPANKSFFLVLLLILFGEVAFLLLFV
jgi:hypothetical protein